ncbi:MAG: 2,3-bisphosphoglycerate-independent phosphoglycerate mutase [Ferruginibacter sp.]
MSKVMLVIMDGWGLGKSEKSDAIQHAVVPYVSSLYNKYPHTTLVTCGTEVGLPEGQMGNSEVGHLNMGAGRIVYQELERINVAIKQGSFQENKVLNETLAYCKEKDKTLHLMGLVSNGGVHSHLEHLKALVSFCASQNFSRVSIHAFLDGRDTDPKSGLGFIRDLQEHLNKTVGQIASLTGRYYAMDRDKRWERIEVAYNAMVKGEGKLTSNITAEIEKSYANGVTDEFLLPIINQDNAHHVLEPGDAVISFNFRTDRCREITEVLTQEDMPAFNMKTLPLHYVTMTRYDESYHNIAVMYEKDNLVNTLGEVVSAAGKSQLRIAETEKYPHVSFFFSGGREDKFTGEERIMISSPKVATYDLQPEMSAEGVTEAAINYIKTSAPDFICLNYANADMVGHTGVWTAIIKAVETVDACVHKLVDVALENDYEILITADHGNADYAINENGTPNTAHTTNPVPLFLISKNETAKLVPGKLGDIAPTILTMMHLTIPAEMTGKILINS